ncbi:MAG: HAMP domain-containing sensor histidine kinase [Bacteroidota bacterium]
MKLINKTIVYYLLISIPMLCVAGLFSYFLIQSELVEGTDEVLANETLKAEQLIATFKEPKTLYLGYDSLSYIKVVSEHTNESVFEDKLIYNPSEEEYTSYRQLTTYYDFNGNTYIITILKTTMEEEELMEGLFSAFALILGFLLIAFFIVSWFLSKTLWRPFYKTLDELNRYDIKQHNAYQFDKSSITEFDKLNAALNEMTAKIHTDFIQQKEFTENASHEMQTPIAVIKANLSLLLQSQNIKAEEMGHLEAIENTIKKLTALNKALILLSKIENNQFSESISIRLNDKLLSAISNYSEMIQIKNIDVKTRLQDDLIVFINPTLADVLISNLLQNAIRHNHTGGTIDISIDKNKLLISNSGGPLSVSEEDLFTRFKKNDTSKDSLGLGLSIVKSITVLYSIQIQYSYTSGIHTFALTFNV